MFLRYPNSKPPAQFLGRLHPIVIAHARLHPAALSIGRRHLSSAPLTVEPSNEAKKSTGRPPSSQQRPPQLPIRMCAVMSYAGDSAGSGKTKVVQPQHLAAPAVHVRIQR